MPFGIYDIYIISMSLHVFMYDSIFLMTDLSRYMFTSSSSPYILCYFTLSLHLSLPSFLLRNLLSFLQERMNNIRWCSMAQRQLSSPARSPITGRSSQRIFSRDQPEPPPRGVYRIPENLIIHNFT